MIGYLRGTIIICDHDLITLLVGGVGYRVTLLQRVPQTPVIGEERSLFISSYVRDGATELYGFQDDADRILFEQLVSVSGVGPKSALAILKLAQSSDVTASIAHGDVTILKKVPGIGSKTAERIVVELKGLFRAHAYTHTSVSSDDDCIEALMRLGYSRASARNALAHIPESVLAPEEKIRHALKNIR